MAIVAVLIGVITMILIFTPYCLANGITAIIGIILASVSLTKEPQREMQKAAITGLILCIIGFYIPIGMFILAISGSEDPEREAMKKASIYAVIPVQENTDKVEVLVANFSKTGKEEIQRWCERNKVKCKITEEYSEKVQEGSYISQTPTANTKIYQREEITVIYSLGKAPTEYKEAIKKAEFYANTMQLSKKRIFTRLTEKNDGGFSKDAAQYAVDSLAIDWNANALAKAKIYQARNISKDEIYQQLISIYGENFTRAEAQYAIEHLEDEIGKSTSS